MTYEVHFVFGRRQEQDLPEYPSGPTAPFVFTISTDDKPSSWESAFALLSFYRDEFYQACLAAETSSWLLSLLGTNTWIPTCYLDRPTIEVVDGFETDELLLDNCQPNPWLSRVAA